MMNRYETRLIGSLPALFLISLPAMASERWEVSFGQSRFSLDVNELESAGVYAAIADRQGSVSPEHGQDWTIADSTLSLEVRGGYLVSYQGELTLDATLELVNDFAHARMAGMVLSLHRDELETRILIGNRDSDAIGPWLAARDSKVAFDRAGRKLLVEIGRLEMTELLAGALGQPELHGVSVGSMAMIADLAWAGGVITPVDEEGGAAGGNNGTVCPNPVGPDVIVGELLDVGNFNPVGDIDAFSVGTESCNIGNANLLWIANNNQHPVIGQSMYRYKNGRFEHIGQSWLKHGFTALTLNLCGCGCNGQGGATLGVGCSDPYGSGLNGSQQGLGPKSQVNPHTGFFTYPHDSSSGNSIYKRLQVRASDLDPNLNGGGTFFVEGQYIAPDDAAAGNGDNNASHRRVTVSGSGNNWSAQMTGPTQRERPAIRAWKDLDPQVVETDIRVPNEGLMILAARATDLGNGMWHYEYALHNMNSDRAAGFFMVPVPASAILQNIGFHDVDYHSGEPYMLDDWTPVVAGGELKWSTVPYDQNPNANALRWGTLYNFRFDSNLMPATGEITIGLFKPGTPATITATTVIPDPTGGDCNFNKLPDYCDVSCNGGVGGECNRAGCGESVDCNGNGVPDECETNNDCNGNFIPDNCDIASGASQDCDANGRPDECGPDHDGDGTPDGCDDDIDGDGLLNGADVCDFTPPGAPIRPNGAQMGDVNADCQIDLADFNHLRTCQLGSGPGMPGTPGCRSIYDINGDTFIDQLDVQYFQNYFTGSSQ